MNFFGSRKRHSSQGFRKYNNEVYEYENSNHNVAGMPNNGVDRSASMTNGAGSAALAALRLHQNSKPVAAKPTPAYSNRQSAYIRSNSLRSNSTNQRSNSLRTYSYHPKGSYNPGQASIPDARRYSSLTSGSNIPAFQQKQSPQQPRTRQQKRLSSLGSSQNHRPDPTLYETHSDDEGETIITTQTTKVVDSQGRVQSITTKTTKTLPDGSNIIETTTKNISRGNSRTNSLRNNSILSSSRDPAYNLQKIEEDLHDFEYNYVLDNQQTQPQPVTSNPQHESRAPHELEDDLLHNSDTLKLNIEPSSARPSLTSSSKRSPDSSVKPLKSILKNSTKPDFLEEGSFNKLSSEAPRPDAEKFDTINPKLAPHPYKSIGVGVRSHASPTAAISEVNVKRSPVLSQSPQTQPVSSPQLKSAFKLSPIPRHDDIISNASVTSPSNFSIKFDENIETIPVYETDFDSPKRKISNSELYSKAMEVAMERVYGTSKELEAATMSVDPSVPSSIIEKKNKRDKKLEMIGHSGVNDNYRYENHHQDFAMHSMRNSSNSKSTSRKERAKEEKKQQKEWEKQQRLEEKQRKSEARLQAKEEAQSKKSMEKEAKKSSPIRGLFGRKKRDNTDASTLSGELSNNLVERSPLNSRAGGLSTNNVLSSPTRVTPVPVFDDNVLHPTENDSQIKPLKEKEQVVPSIVNIQTPLVEPTIKFDSDENSIGQFQSTASEDVRNTRHYVENPITEELAEEFPPVAEAVGHNIIPVAKEPEIPPRSERRNIAPVLENLIIPTPVLNEPVDSENLEDSGILSTSDFDDDRDVARSPSSKKSDNYEQFYEANEPETSPIIKNTLNEVSEEEAINGTKRQESFTEAHTSSQVEIQNLPKEQENLDSVEAPRGNFPIDISKQYTLAELIKMGKTTDSTEDSFDLPDFPNNPDSDLSSRGSADLNAALRRITEDKDISTNIQEPSQVEEPFGKSTPPTESSDDRTPQISPSTIATKEVPKFSDVDETLVTQETKSKTTKKGHKKSKFKDKIFKYFINSYDK
ncbi:hypothetical protein PSN45_004095 [Yamadazyma tenuis]|uniref:Uncharacterized protein n=1 Tax=Candida tenuis (strain ATCC 10573 / BCRC 21748 / CBS 615 / JCM 9827 / NBRC 10315 / NRRL Y-1498 / VKM Y-70) TaxID=590646 RepID=G3B4H8_CANTC|nr:uncharacterized protein CANTEDRAFT_134412 [Yamadazyma tenuis ATCC 10573]EGV63833.1 hypothetical protein CANTEDRAFT_134412 [Yamadazyma tenuis ATCC 10573]WEJ96556.1 hypothetical protein PSN45_004095 [Yamadazyma tenuis]